MTYLGSIVVPAAGSQNNKNTAVPFSIPFNCSRVLCVIDSESSGYNFVTGTNNSLAATTNDFNQVGAASVQIPISTGTGSAQVLAIYNAGAGGTVKVYQVDGVVTS